MISNNRRKFNKFSNYSSKVISLDPREIPHSNFLTFSRGVDSNLRQIDKMGRMRSAPASGHRSGPLKQTNKKHSTGKHKSKGMVDMLSRGRVGDGSSTTTKRKKGFNSRQERKRQAQVERNKKVAETMEKKRNLGGSRGGPICVALIPLSPLTNVEFMLGYILSNLGQGVGTLVSKSKGSTHLKLSSGKNLQFVSPPSGDIWAVLDTLKQADISLFLLPILEELSPEALTLLQVAKDQGLPTPFVAASAHFSKAEEKSWLRSNSRLLPTDKIFPLTNPGQVGNLLRMLSVSKLTLPKGWGQRSSLFIEEFLPIHALEGEVLHPNYVAQVGEETATSKLLQVTGCVRRRNLNPYRPVLISGLGTFRVLRVDVRPFSVPDALLTKEQRDLGQQEPLDLPPRFLFDPLSVPKDDEEGSKVDDDEEMAGGSDIDALDSGDEDGDSNDANSQMSVDVERKGKLPKGTSDYQKDWLLNSDGEADEEILGSDEELEDDGEKEEDQDEGEEEEDEDMDWEEEKRQMEIAKEAKTEAEFPDWVDTPLEIPAKVRFQKYRGLQSFKTSSWDVNENLPKEYAKIFQFKNFKHVAKVVLKDKEKEEGSGYIPVGQRVTLLLCPLEEGTWSSLGTLGVGSSVPSCLVSLLRHEVRSSVLNISLNLSAVLKNKEELIFQLGYHRFSATPILSEISPGNKHKMLRYGQVNQSVMATIFGPIVFPPASVLVFKNSKQELIPVGSGSLFSVDPSRLVIKRVLLSGHPFKVTNRNAVVRFMFFNREDIEWFKPIELRTRYGRRGHIKEPLGTHGHMKCNFDGQMKSQDTVLMPLYKRVFPKWNYDPTPLPPFNLFN